METFPVRYYCPRCEAVVSLERSGYLADKSVTPYPLEGWEYASSADEFESADGVRLVCGEHDSVEEGCGKPFYLNFVRFENGEEIDPDPETQRITIADPGRPPGPRFPEGPGR